MSRTLIGMVTFGNLQFTKLAIESVENTTDNFYDMLIVVGKPGDTETVEWLKDKGIPHLIHDTNLGFPYSLNDIYEYAWVTHDYDNLIIMGNDIICYPNAIDSLIFLADTSEYAVISALQYDVKSLVAEFPETQKFFHGGAFIIEDFSQKPWNLFTNYNEEETIADMQLFDIQNLCLYTRECFNVVGYTDVNFYPAYFVDNDYARRIVNTGLKCCSLVNARFFHFWSRTIHQGEGGSTSDYFQNNQRYYKSKWGGAFGSETRTPPLLIDNRDDELNIVNRWRK